MIAGAVYSETGKHRENTFHLCLYKGVEIVAAAYVEFNIPDSIVIIKSIKAKNNEDKNILERKINEWVAFYDLMITK